MSGQMSLDGFEPKTTRLYNLFLALMPDAGAAARAQALAMSLGQAQGVAVKATRTARFHVTLFHVGNFLDEIPASTLSAVRQAAQRMAAAPFDVAFDKVGSFKGKPGRLPIVLLGAASPGLMSFQSDLDQMMKRAGLTHGEHHRQFTPHLTLFYGRSPALERPIDPITWRAQDFVLIRSVVGEGVYIEEGRWPLRPASPLPKP
ncbi:MAG: 2'-5' RNA ligase family protein [Aquabacterium sp.]|uniref:2'-5' RNA ligase family protein n=1 Tax=Aquabacterium sp. TaxID=1872578 RepID=UPI0025C1D42B|nr:2'-5' RNA ligase family protein [Aquabacterium sp.]MBI3383381.1 2'-5' RNA ligase family protein [Aquabacterium sp.]